MPKPWEVYQNAEKPQAQARGPWTKYQEAAAPAPPVQQPRPQSWSDRLGLENPVLRGATDFVEGAASGAADTFVNGAKLMDAASGGPLIRKALGQQHPLGPVKQQVQSATTAPDSFSGGAGRFTERVAEALYPGTLVTKAARGASLVPRLAAEMGVATGVTGVQTGGDPAAMAESAGTVGVLGGTGAGLSKGSRWLAGNILGRILESNPRPLSPAAIALAKKYNVPLTRGMETGSKATQAAEKLIGHTVAPDLYEPMLEEGQKGLARGAADISGHFAVDEFSAGGGSVKKLLDRAKQLDTASRAAYDDLRSFAEADAREIGTDIASRAKGTEIRTVKYPVELDDFRKPMAGVYGFIKNKVPALQRDSDPAMTYLTELMEGPRVINAAQAEEYLSKFKELARTSKIPELRDKSQGLAAKAISILQPKIDGALSAIPDAQLAQQFARQTWKARSGVFDLVHQLTGDVTGNTGQTQAAKYLLRPADASYPMLKQVIDIAPDAKADLGMAYLAKVLQKAEAGELTNPTQARNLWNQIGKRTKDLLYTPEQVENVNAFLELAKRVNENPNPSGTGVMNALLKMGILASHPVAGGSALVFGRNAAKVLYNPEGAASLSLALKSPAGKIPNRAMQVIRQLAGETAGQQATAP